MDGWRDGRLGRVVNLSLPQEGRMLCGAYVTSPIEFIKELSFQVTVLEASGRVGGRIETHRVPGAHWYIELGAMRIPINHRYS